MVANLTVGRRGYGKVQKEMKRLAEKAQSLKDFFVRAVDDDTFAFNEVMKAREAADEQNAAKNATRVPLSVLEAVPKVLEVAEAVGARGNENSLSDAGVAALTARAAALGAYYNVLINLAGIEDKAFRSDVRDRAEALIAEVDSRCDALDASIVGRLKEALSPPAAAEPQKR
jgi:glutamate formiminotransferase/formiminotetrahydrofolate cyclodeaminase